MIINYFLPNENNSEGSILFDNLRYSINEEEKTSSVVGYSNEINEQVIIPRSIKYKSDEYIVKSISRESLKYSQIKSILFPENSECETIEDEAFYSSKIEYISFPSSLIDLQEGWCNAMDYLTKITIDKNNPRYTIYDDIFVIGKTTIDQEFYDVLVFCFRNVISVTIPNFIEIIASFCFDVCTNLQQVNFQNDSKLRIIDLFAFAFCPFSNISLPSSVTTIGEHAFLHCSNLTMIDIPENSELKKIKRGAFQDSIIESLSIPAGLIELDDEWCIATTCISEINIDENNPRYLLYDDVFIIGKSSLDQDFYDDLVFCVRNANITTIPSFIKNIRPFAFHQCYNINEIIIPEDSNLQVIDKNAFTSCLVSFVSISSHIKIICYEAFEHCINLSKINIPPNSELQEIQKMAFANTLIEEIALPPTLKKICCKAFFMSKRFQHIEIPHNSELQFIGRAAFYGTSFESLTIPSKLIELESDWCQKTVKLTKIFINPKNPRYSFFDNKFIIGKSIIEEDNYDVLVFSVRNIKKALIPSFIKKICSYAFDYCLQLKSVEYPIDSKLSIIEKCAFMNSSIEKISINPLVKKLCTNTFLGCQNLKKINISSDSNLQIIEYQAFPLIAIGSLYIPRLVNYIDDFAFGNCTDLLILEIDENSEMKKFNTKIVINTKEIIIMASCKLKDIFNAN